ncbi:MAG TPA: Ig-like domain-containing protein [Burkholderiaceae bacterium]|nr:Ig-like domain-containing protein [Burkholderiaceae bacterium]
MNQFYSFFKSRVALVPVLAAFVAGCGGGLDPILGTPGAGIAPTVTATTPLATTPPVTGVATNSRVTATFSNSMAAATLTTMSFSVACPAGTAVTASVAYDAATQTATLTPAATLPASTLCVATVTTAAQDTAGFALASNFAWSFMTASAADLTRPTVTITVPAAGASNVATNTAISATFSEDMNPATISGTSFTVANTTLGTAVAGTVSYSAASRTAVFTPTTPGTLPGNTLFTATVTTGAADLVGNTLAVNHVWTFTTAASADSTRPTVVLTVPAAGAGSVPNNSQITATFSEDMNAATISGTSFTLTNTTLGTAVAGSVSYSVAARTATFTPTTPATLANNTLFTATITTAATDLAGNALAGNSAVLPNSGNHVWTFTTAATGDTTAPTVTALSPLDGSTLVCLTKIVSATFSEPMDAATINATTLRVTDNGVAVAGTVTYDAASQVASFAPTAAAGFAASTSFVVTVVSGSAGVKDLAGNPLAAARVWSFTTGTQPCTGGVNLRTAASFGAFGGAAGVTNQGINTVVNGNLGTTAACTLMTGFHDAVNVYTQTPLNIGAVNGSVFCAPPAPGTAITMAIATQALADAQTAYNDLAAMPPGSDPGAGQLGGLVLPAAVYTSAGGTFAITTGDLTLDAQGDANAVWVFQSAAALTVGLPATPRRVLLINGAQAKNVFWQVGSAGRIEDGSTMVGTIIAPAGVTISTAGQTAQTTLIGRALGLTASVTMVNTTIVAP